MNTTILASEKTLRDEFAGQALAGYVDLASKHDNVTVGDVAGDAYDIAEAMLALVLMDHALRHRAQCGDVICPTTPIPAGQS